MAGVNISGDDQHEIEAVGEQVYDDDSDDDYDSD